MGASVGTVLNSRYRLDEELGRGAMGTVYRGHDTLLDRDVAVKVLSAEVLSPDTRARLLREARAAAQLRHPNIVPAFDAGEAEGTPYIVMELEGPSLLDRPPGTLEEVVSIARQMCAALEHAHSHGIVHRDVKPENVLVAADGLVKLADFGLVRTAASRLTAEDTVVGTVYYLAPEQILGHEVDARADLYSLGVLLYELAAGRLPFVSDDALSVIAQHLHAPVVPPVNINPAIPPTLDALIVRLLSKEPANRPASAAEVAQALDGLALSESREVDVPPPGLPVPGAEGERPATCAVVPPHNLPAPLTPFVGRRQQLADVCHALAGPDVRLLTLSGPGGTGKTRLALEAARTLLDEFQDGVFFISLAPIRDPALVLPTIAQILGLHEASGQSVADQLADYLRDLHLLLVLDNLEQVVAAAPAVAGLLAAAPHLKVLATSRALLRIYGEHDYPVPPLARPDLRDMPPLERLVEWEAVQLFVQRAQAARPSFALDAGSAVAVAEICVHVDGLPLAIELAAARLRLLPLARIRAGLSRRLDLLAGGPRDVPSRQQSLRAAIDWSYDLLEADQKRLFRLLAVFVGGFTAEAAEAVGNPPVGGAQRDALGERTPDVLVGLESLAEQSLIQIAETSGEPRFSMLETIREYALERLDSRTGEALAARRSHAAYFLYFAEAAERSLLTNPDKAWLRRMDDEHDNLRAALEWSLRSSNAEADDRVAGVHLASAVSYAWLYCGHVSEGRQWLARAVEQTPAPGPTRAKALVRAGMFSWQQGDYTEAGPQLEESTGLWRELGERDGLAEAAHILAHLRLDQGLHTEARELFQEALDLYQALDNTAMVMTLSDDLALLAYHQGEFDMARSRFEVSLAVHRQQKNIDGIAASLNRLGELARLRGDYALATSLFEESLPLFRELGNCLDIACVLKNLGHVAQARGESARATALFAESMATQREQGNKQGIAECLAGLASVAHPPERAAELFGATEALLDSVGVPLSPADRTDWERNVAALRERLGEPALNAAWAEGCALAAGATAEAWDRIAAFALSHAGT
jgi:predicted ATPase/serine/threonine protein kinase